MPGLDHELLREVNLGFGFDDGEDLFGLLRAGLEMFPRFFERFGNDSVNHLAAVRADEKVFALMVCECGSERH